MFLKRNFWWLKKKCRKCIWLIYIKLKYCWKDEEGVLSIFEVVVMEEEVEFDDFLKFFLGERLKWGWLLKGIGFWFKIESFLNSDLDWDEIEERRRVKFIIKKRKGWMKKGIIFFVEGLLFMIKCGYFFLLIFRRIWI